MNFSDENLENSKNLTSGLKSSKRKSPPSQDSQDLISDFSYSDSEEA
jgi:hypothetical protein